MKKFVATLLAMLMLVCTVAFATTTEEMTNEELIALVAQLQGELAALKGEGQTEETPAEEPVEEPAPEYIDLPKGSKGEEARKLQKRLIELGYLTGSADGIYGNGTAAAVSAFQKQHDLTATGNADIATQELLFSDLLGFTQSISLMVENEWVSIIWKKAHHSALLL